jgi:hypothetical protein
VVAGAASWALFHAVYSGIRTLPVWTPLAVALLGAAELAAAPAVRDRLAGRPGRPRIHPIAVARWAALAKASSPVGAAFLGAWAGVLAYLLPALDKPHRGSDAITALVGVAAGLLLVVAALWLERVCRVKESKEDSEGSRDHERT